MLQDLAVQSFLMGLLSAASLPLGAIIAMYWTPKDRVVAAMMAFGGGALLAALTIDLVAESLRKGEFYPLAAGCIGGGLLFVLLNKIVNDNGGFLRKAATTMQHLNKLKLRSYQSFYRRLSKVPLFQILPPEELTALVRTVKTHRFKKDECILRQGDPGESMFVIQSGDVLITDPKQNNRTIATLRASDVFGEMALITGEPRTASATAQTDVLAWEIHKKDFDFLIRQSPVLAAAMHSLVETRLADLKEHGPVNDEHAEAWYDDATHHLEAHMQPPTAQEVKQVSESHGGAPLAIWLGIFLDGIPESLVIGSSMLHASISFSLLAGLFLSNFPEALSSSVGMRQQKYSGQKIFWMWMSLMIATGIGAYFGNLFFAEAPLFLFALVEGLAAGAMLTMIAETMLPEAFHKGGSVTGLSTLFGFLAAIFFKTLE